MQLAGARLRARQAGARDAVVAQAKFRPQSRIGKQPVIIPEAVKADLKDASLTVKVCKQVQQSRAPRRLPAVPRRIHARECANDPFAGDAPLSKGRLNRLVVRYPVLHSITCAPCMHDAEPLCCGHLVARPPRCGDCA